MPALAYQQQYPQYQQQPGYPLPPGPPKKRTGRLVVVIVAVVVALGAAGGVWFWQSGGESASPQDLPANAKLKTMAFPDLDALGHGEGVEAMCGAVEKVMSARGYMRISDGTTEGGINCRSITPGLSLLTEGAIMMSADVAVWRGDAEARYQRFYDKAVGMRDAHQNRPEYQLSKIEQFPAGDGGYIFHRETKPIQATSGRTDTEAVFRSGDDLMWVAVWGNVNHVAEGGEDVLADPLPEDVTYPEIADIVMSLSGEGEPGELRITKPDLAEHPTLSAVKTPPVAAGASADSVCEKFATAAGGLGVERVSNRATCLYEPPEGASHGEGTVHRKVEMTVVVEEEGSNTPATEKLADDLQSLLTRMSDPKYAAGPVYALPVGDTGYAIPYTMTSSPGSSSGYVQAGYVADGTTYVKVTVTSRVNIGGDLVAPAEDAVIADLVAVLTAIGG